MCECHGAALLVCVVLESAFSACFCDDTWMLCVVGETDFELVTLCTFEVC